MSLIRFRTTASSRIKMLKIGTNLVPGIASMQSILELMPDKDILGLGLAIA